MISAPSRPASRWVRCVVVVALVLGVTGLLLSGDHRAASGAPTDPRADQVRVLLERQGYRVREVSYAPTDWRGDPPYWEVLFDARYTQPTYRAMEAHFITGWWALTTVAAGRDSPKSWLKVGQVWRTYRIELRTRLESAATMIRGLQAARTEAERGQVLQALMRSSMFLDVLDEASGTVPELDFLAANVRDDSSLAVQTIPYFVAAQIKVRLERQGLNVFDVYWSFPEKGGATWEVLTPAAYTQPSYDAVYAQAHKTWWVLHNALSGYEADSTSLGSIQTWRRYHLTVSTSRADYAGFLKNLEVAGTATAARQQAYQAFLKQVYMSVWDTEAKRSVPTEEFVRQHFVR